MIPPPREGSQVPVPNQEPNYLEPATEDQLYEAFRKQVAYDVMINHSSLHHDAMSDRAAHNRVGFMEHLFLYPSGEEWRLGGEPNWLPSEFLTSDAYRSMQPYAFYQDLVNDMFSNPGSFQQEHPELYDKIKQLHPGYFP